MEKNACEKEFQALKACIKKAVSWTSKVIIKHYVIIMTITIIITIIIIVVAVVVIWALGIIAKNFSHWLVKTRGIVNFENL